MLCLKMSSWLVRIREPSGAEGLPPVLFSLGDILLKTLASLATEKLRSLCIYAVKMQEELNTFYNELTVHLQLIKWMGAVAVYNRSLCAQLRTYQKRFLWSITYVIVSRYYHLLGGGIIAILHITVVSKLLHLAFPAHQASTIRIY